MKKYLSFMLSLLLVITMGACSKPEPAAPSPTVPDPQTAPKAPAPAAAAPVVPEDPNYVKNVVYGNAEGVELMMDIAKPAGEGPFPAVVCIHGGGWQLGDKSHFEPTARILAANGYVATTVNYRMTPAHKWPAQVEDVKCAVRYLRAHAQELKINADKIGAIGHSAGAHLSLMLGLTDAKDNLEGNGGYADQSSKVQAVVNLSAPTNLATWQPLDSVAEAMQKEYGKKFDEVLASFVGTSDRSAKVMADASPVTYIDSSDPPVLTWHGSVDPLVPCEQAKELDAALEKAGVTHKLVIAEGSDHGISQTQVPVVLRETSAFFGTHLKGEHPASVASPEDSGAPESTAPAAEAEAK